ncbi:MAG: helix-turn-helix domain-containing protein [Oscillospiraceae bacterium]
MEQNIFHDIYYYEDTAFPFQMTCVTKDIVDANRQEYYDYHWHEEPQFTLVIKDKVIIQVNGIEYELHKGEGLFINCGCLHCTPTIYNGEYISFNFHTKFLSFFSGSRMEQNYVFPYVTNPAFQVKVLSPTVDWEREVLDIMAKLESIMCDDNFFAPEYLISIKTVEIWYLLIKHISSEVTKQPQQYFIKQQRIHKMLEYIHQHYSENLSTKDIADAANISVGECCRCFKTVLLTTPQKYLSKYRINKAIELLNSTGYTITEIAQMVGFNYTSHFIEHFKRNTNMTPNAYRSKKSRGGCLVFRI